MPLFTPRFQSVPAVRHSFMFGGASAGIHVQGVRHRTQGARREDAVAPAGPDEAGGGGVVVGPEVDDVSGRRDAHAEPHHELECETIAPHLRTYVR